MMRLLNKAEISQVSGGDYSIENSINVGYLDVLTNTFSSTPLNVGEDAAIASQRSAERAGIIAQDVAAMYQGIGTAQGNPSPAGSQVNDTSDPNSPSQDANGIAV